MKSGLNGLKSAIVDKVLPFVGGVLFVVSLSLGVVLTVNHAIKPPPAPPAPVQEIRDLVCFDNWGTSKRFPTLVRAVRDGVVWEMEYDTGEKGTYVQLAGESCWQEIKIQQDNQKHRPVIGK